MAPPPSPPSARPPTPNHSPTNIPFLSYVIMCIGKVGEYPQINNMQSTTEMR